MGKIKINLSSGNIFEKPVVTCFKGASANYLVLDSETNGSMNLPIICVGRLEGSTVNKIVDPAEWTAVKENLKSIIGGNALPYLPVPEVLSASDDFFTQLTLPVASFDLLKNTYHVDTPVAAAQPANTVPSFPDVSSVGPTVKDPEPPKVETPAPIDLSAVNGPVVPTPGVAPQIDSPVQPTPVVGVQPQVVQPVIDTPSPVAPTPEPPTFTAPSPVMETPQVTTPETVMSNPANVMEDVTAIIKPLTDEEINAAPTPVVSEPVSVEPQVAEPVPTPVIDTPSFATPTPEVAPFQINDALTAEKPETSGETKKVSLSDDDIAALKETFMKSCENMFDGLIEKFKN